MRVISLGIERCLYFLLLKNSLHSTGRGVWSDQSGWSGLRVDWVLKNVCLVNVVDVFFSSRSNHTARGAYWLYKGDMLCEKNAKHGSWGQWSRWFDSLRHVGRVVRNTARTKARARACFAIIRSNFPALHGGNVPWLKARYWGANPMLKRRSLFQRCVTLPVGTWSVARNNRFAASAVMCASSQLRTSSERKLSLSVTRQPIIVEIGLFYVFSLSNSLVFVSFLRKSDRKHTQEHAGSMPSTQAVQRQARATTVTAVRTCERSTKEPIATRPSIAKDSWTSGGSTARFCRSMKSYGRVLAVSSLVLAAKSKPVYLFVQPLSISLYKVCLGTPFEFFFTLDHALFLETSNTEKTWKWVPNARLPR